MGVGVRMDSGCGCAYGHVSDQLNCLYIKLLVLSLLHYSQLSFSGDMGSSEP